MDIESLLDFLDGRGLILTDDDLLDEALKSIDLSFESKVIENQ